MLLAFEGFVEDTRSWVSHDATVFVRVSKQWWLFDLTLKCGQFPPRALQGPFDPDQPRVGVRWRVKMFKWNQKDAVATVRVPRPTVDGRVPAPL